MDLERYDRYPWFDKRRDSLPLGENFPGLIFQAIRECQVAVVVLSEKYFTSKWPMLELNALVTAQMENMNMKILPVYVRISPTQCRDESYIRKWVSMWHHMAENDKRVNVEEWKQALNVLLSINGISLHGGTSEVQCRRKIVKAICKLVPPNTFIDDSYIEGKSRFCEVRWS